MLRGEDSALAEVAASVADGDVVDWGDAAGRIPEGERRLLPHLQLVQTISQLHRTLPGLGSAPEADAPPLKRWGNFLLLERIGEGTTGEVYRAWDSHLHRDVALKLLHQDRRSRQDAQERVLEEARRLARVRHEHVVSVHGAEEHGGRVGLWMELVRGESLDERVKTHGPLAGDEAARIGQQLCSALAAVHASGLLHRDVKAQNVIQEPSGRIVLMDFGTGEELRHAAGTTRMAGTPLYLAPEIFTGEPATIQSDIYSLGVLLFYLVTGAFPVTARSMPELGRAHNEGSRRRLSELRPDLPKPFVEAVERALDRDSGLRYRTAGEMEVALRHASAATAVAPVQSGGIRARWPFLAAAVVLLAAAVALIVWTRQAAVPPLAGAVKRIAVAPMALIDPATAPSHFAEGLTDQLIATLGQIQSLRIKIDPLAAPGHPSAAARDDVDAVLETTLLAVGPADGAAPRVRVNARLIAAVTGTVTWTGTFEHALGDTFALQAAIARQIATAVNGAITSDEEQRLQRVRQTSPEAEAAFLEGLAHIDGYGVEYAHRALDAFKRAIDADPNHAAARAGAARAYFTLGNWSAISQPVARTLALGEAQKALELDDGLPDAHATLAGISFYYDWNWKDAEAGYLRSLELNPSYWYGRQLYSQVLAAAQRTKEAVVEAQFAVDLEPTSALAHRNHATVLYYDRDFPAAEAAIRKSLEVDGAAPSAWIILGRIAEAKGDLDAAREHTQRAADLMPSVPTPVRVQQLRFQALAGARADALSGLQRLREDAAARGVLWNPAFDAYVHLASGDHDQALGFLELAAEQRQPSLLWVAVDPRMEPLRTHPRFQSILRSLGLIAEGGS